MQTNIRNAQENYALLYVLALFALVWPIVATLSHHSPPLDVIESYVWSLNPQWGYYKHPPLPAWITSVAINTLGKHLYVLMLLGPLSILVSLLAIGWLAKELLSKKAAVVAIFITTTSLYFNFLIPEFNHNVVQIPLWASALALFWACMKYGRYRHFIMLGFVLGLCFLAKYSAAILYALLFVIAITVKKTRTHLTIGKISVCILVLGLTIAPNVYWLIENDFQPFNYLEGRLGQKIDWFHRIYSSLQFILAQLLANAVTVYLVIRLWIFRRTKNATTFNWNTDSKILISTFIFPVGLSALVPLISGHPLRDMWAMMMFTSLGLGIVHLCPNYFERFYSKKWLIIWGLFQVLVLIAYVGKTQLTPYYKHKLSRATFPGPEIAQIVEGDWNKVTRDAPLRYVVGDGWLAGNISFFAKSSPQVLIQTDFSISPWVTLENLEACGYIFVAEQGQSLPKIISEQDAKTMRTTSIHFPEKSDVISHFQWIIVPPKQACH